MTRKQTIILAALFLLAAIGTIAYLYFSSERRGGGDDTESPGFGSFFPVSPGGSNPTGAVGINADGTPSIGPNVIIPSLRLISAEPVAGYTTFDIPSTALPFGTTTNATSTATTTTREPSITYTQRATGHVFQAFASNLSQQRISQTTIPKVYEAYYLSSTTPIYRYLGAAGTVQNYSAVIDVASTTLSGTFLPSSILSLAPSPDGRQIAQVRASGIDMTLMKTDRVGGAATTLFSSNVTEWLVQWPDPETIFITTKADSRYPGTLYSIDARTGAFDRHLFDINGLTTLANPTGTKVLYSYASPRGTETALYDVATRSTILLSFSTLAEKCVWSKIDTMIAYCGVPYDFEFGAYPEDWYQGSASFNDNLWRVDASTGSASIILDREGFEGNSFDMTNLQLSPDESFLYFINKQDLTLWSYDLKSD
jgi:hypothetical protein